MKLVRENDPILTSKCDDVDLRDAGLVQQIADMCDTLSVKNGLGLAAPQVGISNRLFITNYDGCNNVCINPEILETSEETTIYKEGCLSFPKLYLVVRRPAEIRASWTDDMGLTHKAYLKGMEARIFQHEYDHINGVVFTSKVSNMKLSIANKKRRKAKT